MTLALCARAWRHTLDDTLHMKPSMSMGHGHQDMTGRITGWWSLSLPYNHTKWVGWWLTLNEVCMDH